MARPPASLQKLISLLRKFPGVGIKSAERYAFELLNWESPSLDLLAESIRLLRQEVYPCPTCHCLKGKDPCEFCDINKRQTNSLCIVSHAKDVYPIEETHTFKGLYHVLGTLFSPMQGHYSQQINIENIKKRVLENQITDIILALDSTLEGDATALFLKQEMQSWGLSISRLAFGMPLGSSFEYVDSGTLARAFLGRHQF